VALWVISWIIAPLITQLLALAVSRKREYLADAMSAQFTRNPLALASALEKIEAAAAPTTSIKRGAGAAHLCIADPLGGGSPTGKAGSPTRLRPTRRWACGFPAQRDGYAELKNEGGLAV